MGTEMIVALVSAGVAVLSVVISTWGQPRMLGLVRR